MEQIKNDKLTVTINEHGAELVSIKDNGGEEYLWDGDAKYWNRHSPILFPLVGTVWNDTFRINSKEYTMKRHGFARDNDFRLIARGDDRAVFAFHDNAETLKAYPYRFNLGIGYRLDGNKLHVVWHVENTDDKEIYFQIGGHPAFLVPGAKKGEPLAGTLRLDNPEPVRSFCTVNGCRSAEHKTVETDNGLLHFTEDTFADDALVFDHCQLKHIEILDTDGKPHVSLDIKTPAVGIWSPQGKHAPFVCIEPWYGVADRAEYDGEFKDRYLMNKLLPGSSFMSEYTITIG